MSNKVHIKALILSTIAAAIGFIIIEFLVEILFFKTFGLTENGLYEHFNISPSGVIFQIVNLIIFFLQMGLIMVVYVSIRPRFSSDIITALLTAGLFISFAFLYQANFSNLGIFPLNLVLTSLIFTAIELPFALMIGAVTYSSRTETK